MEGVNLGGFMWAMVGFLFFGVTSLVALGLLIARQARPAMIVFATGWLCGAGILALATLTFLERQFHPDGHEALIVLTALSVLLGGAGQFVAALRGGRAYGVAVGCAAAAFVVLTVGLLVGTDVLYLGEFGRPLRDNHVPLAAASLALAAASLAVAILVPSAPRSDPQVLSRG